jgi:hypothetical protein
MAQDVPKKTGGDPVGAPPVEAEEAVFSLFKRRQCGVELERCDKPGVASVHARMTDDAANRVSRSVRIGTPVTQIEGDGLVLLFPTFS